MNKRSIIQDLVSNHLISVEEAELLLSDGPYEQVTEPPLAVPSLRNLYNLDLDEDWMMKYDPELYYQIFSDRK